MTPVAHSQLWALRIFIRFHSSLSCPVKIFSPATQFLISVSPGINSLIFILHSHYITTPSFTHSHCETSLSLEHFPFLLKHHCLLSSLFILAAALLSPLLILYSYCSIILSFLHSSFFILAIVLLSHFIILCSHWKTILSIFIFQSHQSTCLASISA